MAYTTQNWFSCRLQCIISEYNIFENSLAFIFSLMKPFCSPTYRQLQANQACFVRQNCFICKAKEKLFVSLKRNSLDMQLRQQYTND